MSLDNVEVIRRGFDALNRGDAEAIAALSADDFELISVLSAVEERTYRGKDAWGTYLRLMSDTWSEWRFEQVEIFDVDDETAAAVYRVVGRGKRSGARVEHPIGATFRLRNGKLLRIRSYLDPREALEAVGLSEPDAHAES
jgi:ketosteroid isomerase-like protein